MKEMNCAIVGCGMISKSYLNGLTKVFDNLHVTALCDAVAASAQAKSEEYGIPVKTLDEILADDAIEMVIILTPAPTHYALIKQALLAAKHVFTEKVMTLDLSQAKELLEIAEEKGVRLGSAPDTFMGSAVQKAHEVLKKDTIGEVTAFHISLTSDLDKNASIYRILRMPGGGICSDMGVYYLTALVNLLGPVKQVAAIVENRKPVRIDTNPDSPDFGNPYEYNNESQVTAVMRTASGITGTLSLNGETANGLGFRFELYGRKGMLKLADPNRYSNDIYTVLPGEGEVLVENELPTFVGRGLGPSEMADAIRCGRPHKASKEQAYHVLEIIDALFKSSESKTFVNIESRF